MQESFLLEFRCRRFSIRARWEALLRAEPVTSPLGLPEALVHLIDSTLDEILSTLADPTLRFRSKETISRTREISMCSCGRNPYLAYFSAAEQATREGLVLAQAELSRLDPIERDAALKDLNAVLQEISRREIESFCGVCQFRHLALPAPVQPLAICGG